jgi:hypothetical protein
MRTLRLLLLALACLPAACGGNFSNGDLEFLNALPVREDLASKLPTDASRHAASLHQRTDRRQLQQPGEQSQLYADTHAASESFNKGLDGLLTLLEAIRDLPPTEREPDRRLWGPYPYREHPGHELRFVMVRGAENFSYALQVRKAAEGEAGWWSFVEGSFLAEGGLRKGQGLVSLKIAEARARGFATREFPTLDRLDIGYQTRALPIWVQMHFVPRPDQSATEAGYAYRELPEGLGEMGFVLQDSDLVPGGRQEKLSVLSRWTQDRGGVGLIQITGGDVPFSQTYTHVECWDADFRVTYAARSWESRPVGDATSCPDVSALER